MFKLESEPTDAQAILEKSIDLYRHTLSFTVLYSFIIATIISLPLMLIHRSFWHWHESSALCFILFAALIAFIFSSALLFHLYCYSSNVPSSIALALKQIMIKSPSLLLLMLTYILIVLSGTLLFIIPGIFFAFSLMFSFLLVLTANQSVFQSLTGSHQLVKQHWWHTFAIMSTPLLLNIVISLICFISVAEYGMFLKFSTASISLILAFVNIFIQMMFIPFIMSVTIVLLHDLRLRKSLASPPWN